jgi:endonuclease/exonuclease/phosphatase (EEP) superfamily protein YafD
MVRPQRRVRARCRAEHDQVCDACVRAGPRSNNTYQAAIDGRKTAPGLVWAEAPGRWYGVPMVTERRRLVRRARAGLAVLLGSLGCVTSSPEPRTVRPGEPSLSVLTYNVNFGLAGEPDTLAAVLASGADVVLLQETTPDWEAVLREANGGRYTHIEFRHCCGAGGLGILSRFPYESAEYVDNPAGWFPAWRLVVQTPLGPVQFLSLHLRPPVSDRGSWVSGYFTTGSHRLAEIQQFATLLTPGLPAVVLGDFNEEDGAALDHLRDRGLSDAVAELRPDTDTWHWPTSVGDLGFALDHVFHSAELVAVEAEVLELGRSDHWPVRVVFVRR